jgi:pimeloyl-ACP methyl ester carboxylesterase
MFVGHYSVSFAVKKLDKTIPLWVIFLAVQLVDVFLSVFVLLGIGKPRILLTPLLLLLLCAQAATQSVQPTKIQVRGVELHYIEQGQGEPLILLHGGMGDYRSWEPQIKAFSQHYRVISYSRRYNYPNNNPHTAKNHSAYVEADDLAAFIHKLKLGHVHLVGASYGAFTALVLAVKHPEIVRSLVLAEPPVLEWVRYTPNGAGLYREYMTTIHEPVATAFKEGDDEGAMRIFVDGLYGTGRFDNLPPEGRAAVMQNSRFFKAIMLSSDPFPNLSEDKVKRLHLPILIVTGENTIKLHKLVNEELGRVLPNAAQAFIPQAGHGSPRENPQAFNEAVLKFLAQP